MIIFLRDIKKSKVVFLLKHSVHFHEITSSYRSETVRLLRGSNLAKSGRGYSADNIDLSSTIVT